MRALVQRVSKASVTVEGRVTGSIGRGYAILVGVTHDDSYREAEWLANKIVGLRLFEDDAGKMNLSIVDVGGSILLVSQFTLYANASKGRRPSFTAAAHPDQAEPLVSFLADEIRARGIPVETGVFGAMMSVEIVNDGPVTLMIER
ncbi:MAG TPA: D-aminoacyl-tRNA deacylase [candidate division Zixibacteria bacterium]|nr:D-aminoacyl-tRNA deacylase [candidate division Zixibacteria bacterium]